MMMADEHLTRNRRLLELKGVAIEEETPKPESDSQWILEQYEKKKASTQDAVSEFDDLDLEWNPNNTLSRLTATKNGDVLYSLDFVWGAMGQLTAIRRS
ncbi:hypothetical protein MUP79_05645 [Candidatus Bathyarchaeota archaeon]|nr:hypothetical protein [Candidatus Bathyarchaeota archaeon]